MSDNNDHGIYLSYSDSNSLLGNTVKDNTANGIHLAQSRNNIIEGNFIINNVIGIYLINNIRYYTLFEVKSAGNEISNNFFSGNNQEIQEITNLIDHPYRSVMIALIVLLSIVTFGIVIISLAVEVIRKRSYPKEDERYHLPIYGVSALILESAGAIIFILGALFLIPIDSLLFWLFILIPFSLIGVIISRDGRKKDAKKTLAGLGLAFGIPLLVLGGLLIFIVIAIAIAVIVVVYIMIMSQ